MNHQNNSKCQNNQIPWYTIVVVIEIPINAPIQTKGGHSHKYTGCLRITLQLWSGSQWFRIKILVFHIVRRKVCGFVTCLSFECKIFGLLILYSQTKMLKLRKSQTLHEINTQKIISIIIWNVCKKFWTKLFLYKDDPPEKNIIYF